MSQFTSKNDITELDVGLSRNVEYQISCILAFFHGSFSGARY